MEPGLLLAHKPRGATSTSLVRALQSQSVAEGHPPGEPPICHAGALDPFAEGLLILLAGPATRLMEELHPIPKWYEAEVVWGAETDTGDLLGRTVAKGDAGALTPALLDAALPAFLGWRDQVPPATSNKRVGGERAYARAHRGEEVALAPAPVFLHQARWLSHHLPRSSRLWISVRGGFYVRSLARDLGRALGCRAHLGALARTAIGPWRDPGPPGAPEPAERGPAQLPAAAAQQWIRGAALLPWLPSRALTEEEVARAGLKRPLPRGTIASPEWPLPAGFAGPDAQVPRGALAEAAPIRGLCGDRLRLLLRARGDQLVLRTDLDCGI